MLDFTTANFLQLLEFTLALIVSGAASGLIAGLFGVGGGIITVPVLYTIFKIIGTPANTSIHMAIGTSLAVILITARASVRAHKRKGAVDAQIVKRWAAFVLIGAACGAVAANRISGPALTLTFAIFSVFIAALMGLAPPKLRVAKHPPKGLLQAPIAALIGFISALVGVGGGSLSVPTLVLCSVPMHRAVGTASAIGLPHRVSGDDRFSYVDGACRQCAAGQLRLCQSDRVCRAGAGDDVHRAARRQARAPSARADPAPLLRGFSDRRRDEDDVQRVLLISSSPLAGRTQNLRLAKQVLLVGLILLPDLRKYIRRKLAEHAEDIDARAVLLAGEQCRRR